MYVVYWISYFSKRINIELLDYDDFWLGNPSESCWMIPNTVDPLS